MQTSRNNQTMFVTSVALVICLQVLSRCVQAQFQLSFGNPTQAVPTTPRPTLPGGFDPACKDVIDNCKNYGQSACSGQYLSWAQKNCEATCGFCKPLPTQPPACVDKLPDCATYESGACTAPSYRAWAEENCRAYCRLCTNSQLSALDALTTRATTRSPASCVDKVDCARYGQDACNPSLYGEWGAQNCPAYCGICQGIATPAPQCADTRTDCNMFQSDLCTNALFTGFVDGNCRKFCQRC